MHLFAGAYLKFPLVTRSGRFPAELRREQEQIARAGSETRITGIGSAFLNGAYVFARRYVKIIDRLENNFAICARETRSRVPRGSWLGRACSLVVTNGTDDSVRRRINDGESGRLMARDYRTNRRKFVTRSNRGSYRSCRSQNDGRV